MSVLGFNLGIEAMQLLVVLLVMPVLVLLRRTERYKAVRLTGATVGAVAACVWIAERAFGPHGPA